MYEIKKEYWPNGKLKRETTLLNNKRQGVQKNYDERGVLKSAVDYCDDLIDGYIKTYFKSGMTESRELFNKGIRMNELLIYNENGVLVYSSSSEFEANPPLCVHDNYFYKFHL